MSQVTGLQRIALQVRNVSLARRFYEGVLGLAAEEVTEGRIRYGVNAPFEISEAVVDLNAGSNYLGWGISLVLTTADVAALFDRVKQQGFRIHRPLSQNAFGWSFECLDDDGHRLTVAQA